MKSVYPLLVIVIVIILHGCTSNSTDPALLGNVEGKIVSALNDDPLEGIEIILLSRDVEIDTITFQNDGAFLDTVITDVSGNYEFSGLEPGNYAVAPIDNSYRYESSNDTGSNEFEIIGDDTHTLDFVASPNVMSGWEGIFDVTVNVTNLPSDYYEGVSYQRVYRKVWYLFIPVWAASVGGETEFTSPRTCRIRFTAAYGYVYVVISEVNEFRIVFSNGIEDFANGIGQREIIVGTPLGDTPSSVVWEYDYQANTIRRVE